MNELEKAIDLIKSHQCSKPVDRAEAQREQIRRAVLIATADYETCRRILHEEYEERLRGYSSGGSVG